MFYILMEYIIKLMQGFRPGVGKSCAVCMERRKWVKRKELPFASAYGGSCDKMTLHRDSSLKGSGSGRIFIQQSLSIN
jgi:hypothetical protein